MLCCSYSELDQINQAMHQMGIVTQRNRAMVEQANQAASTLKEEAERTRDFSSRLRLGQQTNAQGEAAYAGELEEVTGDLETRPLQHLEVLPA